MPENNEDIPRQEKSVGTLLREAREARHLSLEQVGRMTRIHVHVLKALEADDAEVLGVVYTMSFLRLYADFLGLDKKGLAARFAAVAPKAVAPIKGIATPAPSGAGFRATAKMGLRIWVQICRLMERVPWPRVMVVVLAVLFVWGMGHMIKGCRTRSRERRASTVQTATKGTAALKGGKNSSALAAAVNKDSKKVVLVVRAIGKTWLQVKADGKIIFQSVLAKGSSESWKADEKIELWIGDAGALELEVNGRFLDRIGRKGQTLKEVVITPKGLVVRG